MKFHAMPGRRLGKIRTKSCGWRLRLQCCCEDVRQVWFYNAKKDGKIGDIAKKTKKTVHIRLRLVRTLTISCGALRSQISNQSLGRGRTPRKKRKGETYFLFLFEPPGSSTSIPSSSFRPALAAARLLAFCFSRRRSATSLSTTFRASSC
jgi:hypothetical protein